MGKGGGGGPGSKKKKHGNGGGAQKARGSSTDDENALLDAAVEDAETWGAVGRVGQHHRAVQPEGRVPWRA